MLTYNLLEYSNSYSMTSGSLWNYYIDEIDDSAIENNDDGKKINNNEIIASKSFEYKTKIIIRTPDDNNTVSGKLVRSMSKILILRKVQLKVSNCC